MIKLIGKFWKCKALTKKNALKRGTDTLISSTLPLSLYLSFFLSLFLCLSLSSCLSHFVSLTHQHFLLPSFLYPMCYQASLLLYVIILFCFQHFCFFPRLQNKIDIFQQRARKSGRLVWNKMGHFLLLVHSTVIGEWRINLYTMVLYWHDFGYYFICYWLFHVFFDTSIIF